MIYLISKIENNRKIIESIYISAVSFFSDKVRNTIEKDLSKRWTLAIIADEFNVSEITIRKRLESERITFNQILMQSRMSKAALLLLEMAKVLFGKEIVNIKHLRKLRSSWTVAIVKP